MRDGEDNEAQDPKQKAGSEERREENSLIVQHSALQKRKTEEPMQTRSDLWAQGLIVAACLGLGLWAAERFWPRALPIVENAILPCVSYAPFRYPDHSPFDPRLRIDRASLRADLAQIRSLSPCLRTYGLDHGMDQLPDIAREMGLRLRLGLWLGQDPVANRREIEQAVDLASAYPDVVEQVIVGNEVLLRGDLSPEALADILAEMQQRVDLPITYADVWEFWRRHAAVLRPHVDSVAVHILPYWEDDPIAVDQAVEYLYARYAEMQALFAPLPVWVGETGWPARGRSRGGAVPGVYEQAFFVHSLLHKHQSEPMPFNLIEAFDQPWKRVQEGAMGGAWGVFDSGGHQRVDWRRPGSGAVANGVTLAGLAGLFGFGLLLRWRERHAAGGVNSPRRLRSEVWFVTLLILGLLAAQLEMAWIWSRSAGEWATALLQIGVTSLLSLVLAAQILSRRSGAPDCPSCPPGLLPWLVGLWLVLVLITAHGLVFDGRYRAFAWPLLLGPVVLGAAAILRGVTRPWHRPPIRWMAYLAGLAGLVVVYQEGLENRQALGYGALLVCVTALVVLAARIPPREASGEGVGPADDQASSRISGKL